MATEIPIPWPSVEEVLHAIQIPPGITVRSFEQGDVHEVTRSLKLWYPDVAPGEEGVHLDNDFWLDSVYDSKANPKAKVFGLLAFAGNALVGFQTFEHHARGNHQMVRLGAVAPQARGQGIGEVFTEIWETMAAQMQVGLLWCTVTLSHMGTQKICQRRGWQLCGIFPAFDRDWIPSKGRTMFVSEAIFCKVIAPESEVFGPESANMIPEVKTLWEYLHKK